QAPTADRYPEQVPEPFAPEPSAKVIEFPRSAAIPVFHRSELADPVFDLDRPRIVEAPEVLPPPPALGGMLMEPAQPEAADRQAGADFPLPSESASIARRALAALVDGIVLGTALAAFAAIFIRINPSLNPAQGLGLKLSLNLLRGPLPIVAAALAAVTLLFWAAYEFLFVVYTGSTPGLRAARLRLAAFDGSPLNRRSRRWRVLASFLSAGSAGLGYCWCFLDQDGLCWHDRITRTHVKSNT
ncbi:MAG: RDD family protein, partial [Terriglobales bacterium]